LTVIDKVAFMAAWMDVKAAHRTWFPILRDVLRMREKLDLHWIPPSQYPTVGDMYSDSSVRLISILNHVDMERWSHVETAVDGETRESTDLGLVEINPDPNATIEAAGEVEAGTLPQPSSTAPSENVGTVVAKTWCGEGTMS
jgi:hypothetical protein